MIRGKRMLPSNSAVQCKWKQAVQISELSAAWIKLEHDPPENTKECNKYEYILCHEHQIAFRKASK